MAVGDLAFYYTLYLWKHYTTPGGRLELFFDGVFGPRSETRTHIYGFFFFKKRLILCFFSPSDIFTNRDPFLRVFLPKNGWFYHFLEIFVKWEPLLMIFLSKMGPMSEDFLWKGNPFERHIPICLNMWVYPGLIPIQLTLLGMHASMLTCSTTYLQNYCSRNHIDLPCTSSIAIIIKIFWSLYCGLEIFRAVSIIFDFLLC